MAPVGRWQQNRDLTWYAKNAEDDAEAEKQAREAELRMVKEAEQEALARALGLPVAPKTGNATGANATAVAGTDVDKLIKDATGDVEDNDMNGVKGVGFGGYDGTGEGVAGSTDRLEAMGLPSDKDSRKHRTSRNDRKTDERSRRHHHRDNDRRRDEDRDRDRERHRDRSHDRGRDRSRERNRHHRHSHRKEHKERDRRSEYDNDRADRRRHRSRSRSPYHARERKRSLSKSRAREERKSRRDRGYSPERRGDRHGEDDRSYKRRR